ncbi:MAG: hypothetical protein HQ522_08940 [Bacteroidetes bacterium]|nr:hypothetical protein [Bacteroidota bacterium]
MKQNVDKSGLATQKKSSVWKINVGVHSPISDKTQSWETGRKLWEIKVILN